MSRNAWAFPPRKIVIESTQACQLKCGYCPTGLDILSRPNWMNWDLFEKIADEIEGYARHVYLEFMGEPLLHSYIGDMIRRIKKFATVDIATNGILAYGAIGKGLIPADVVSVTICGLGDVYKQIHGVDRYEDAMAGLRHLVKIRDGKVLWTWLVLRENEHQFAEARALCEEIGAKWHPKGVALGLDRSRAPVVLREYRRYHDDGRLIYDRRKCPEFWEVGYICSDGAMAYCGFDWAAVDSPGNVGETSLLQIWNGEEYRKARRDHLAGKLHPVCRLFCGCPSWQGRDNEYLGERGFLQ